MANNPLAKSFSKWRVLIPVFIGLAIASWMIYQSVKRTTFIKVEANTGNYKWIDSSGNKTIDIHDESDFIAVPQGDYNLESFNSILASIDWGFQVWFWLLMAFVFMIGRDLFYIIRIRILTKGELSWRRSFIVIMLWEFASALSPGVVGGAAVAMFILNREKIALGRSTAIVVITALLDNLFYVLMIPLVFIVIDQNALFPESVEGSRSVQAMFWTGFAVITSICAFLFACIFIFSNLAKSVLGFMFRIPFLKRWRNSAIQTGEEIYTTSKELKKEPVSFWVKTFLSTCGSWVSRYLVINAILQAFLNLSVFEHFLLLGKQLVLWLFMLISPTPGASGVAEYAFGELLSNFTASAMLLVALALIWRLLSYFPYLIIGAVLVPRWLRGR
ncbi:MAG: lysylphosphatidylglycerol synthase transmembrane domain-containing protein [Flavobacteriales bacterium]|jgi:glycosyltransferase 2 family protein